MADDSFYPILDDELFYFNSQRLDAIGVEYGKEQDADKRLMKLEAWLALTPRPFTPRELKSPQAKKYLPRAIPLAYNCLANIVTNEHAVT